MRRALALIALLPLAAAAQDGGTADAARAAADRIREAAALMDSAEGAGDRLAALTRTVRAYEEGLALTRDVLRRIAGERAGIESEIGAGDAELGRLLGTLQAMRGTPGPATALNPAGAVGTVRAGMLLTEAVPALGSRAEALRGRMADLAALEAAQDEVAAILREGLADVQAARTELAAAAAGRAGLPRAYTEDPVATALLMASAESLDAFADGLAQTVDEAVSAPPEAAEARRGTLPLPEGARILRPPGEADAAGVARPGVMLALEPRAMVTVPVTATLRFRGPLLDYGTVAILEPAPGTLFVLAGLAQVFGEAGEILPEGSPLGLMGGVTPDADAILTEGGDAGDAASSESLYLEVREDGAAVDPATWFQLD